MHTYFSGTPADSQESTTAPAVFVVPKPADDTTQALGIKINGVAEDVRLLQDSRGYP